MHRKRRENLPPPPLNAEEADEFLTSIRYSGQNFAKHYQGLVCGSEDNERALTFAHEGDSHFNYDIFLFHLLSTS